MCPSGASRVAASGGRNFPVPYRGSAASAALEAYWRNGTLWSSNYVPSRGNVVFTDPPKASGYFTLEAEKMSPCHPEASQHPLLWRRTDGTVPSGVQILS